MQSRSSTDIDRKLAIYYHPLFQEIIKSVLLLFKAAPKNDFEIGLFQFVEFNLKLQKALLPNFEIQNALISGLNDWVKQVAECLSYDGMISTSKCEQITPSTLPQLLEQQLHSLKIDTFVPKQQYLRVLAKFSHHDAFKLLGIKINKEVFNKFMFDLCSTWCEFLDIELFCYFLIGIYVQISEGDTIEESRFRQTLQVNIIALEFMEEFEEIKANYSRSRKKELRYYRAWCEWNYLRINDIGEALILQLDQLHQHDSRILQLALLFERAIQVINEEITSQNQLKLSKDKDIKTYPNVKMEGSDGEYLIMKRLNVGKQETESQRVIGNNAESSVKNQDSRANNAESSINNGESGINNADSRANVSQKKMNIVSQNKPQVAMTRNNVSAQITTTAQSQPNHSFEIQIDAQGNMYLKKVVRLPVLGTKILLQAKTKFLEKKRQQCREISNLYRRLDSMKVRLQHNIKNDPYSYKHNAMIAERDRFYSDQVAQSSIPMQMPGEKAIHGKMKPDKAEDEGEKEKLTTIKEMPKREEHQPLRSNQNYIHKVMAPSFLTDNENNISYSKGQGYVYGIGVHSQKRDLKIGLPKLKHLDTRLQARESYHLVGNIVKDRMQINRRLRVLSTTQQPVSKLEQDKEEYKHVWSRYIDQQEMKELTDYSKFYQRLEVAKKQFSNEHQSEYRLNLRRIDLYENRRYEMGGVLEKQEQERFYLRMAKLINKQKRKQQRGRRKKKLRQYRRVFRDRDERTLYENIFLGQHRQAIHQIKMQRAKVNVSFTH